MSSQQAAGGEKTSITPLLKRLWHETSENKPSASEIAGALGLIFTNSLSEVQTGALLTCLHFTGEDRKADILTKCAQAMRDFSTGIDVGGLGKVIESRGRREGSYQGGLVCVPIRPCTNQACSKIFSHTHVNIYIHHFV